MRNSFTLRAISFVMLCILSAASVFAAEDAGVQTILTPSTSVCRGNASVTAIIQNFGATTINTVEVHWSVDGISQPTYSYSGLMPAGNQDTVMLGMFNFQTGPYTVVAWTEIPNGSADGDNSNDTTTSIISISNQLTGTYTIGGASPDYANFSAAVTALINNGVCGPVVFNMRPQTDTVRLIITEIPGADSTNNITFQSENGDSTSVVLTYPSLDTLADNYLIMLDGADFLTFSKITMQRTGTELNARIIDFINNATNNTITNCRLIGVTGPTTNSLTALIYSSGGTSTNDSNITITNNLLKDGSLGIYMNGISTLDLEENIVIRNNTFTNQMSKGIQMANIGHAIIEGNVFTTTTSYTGYAGIYLDRSNRPHMILKNQILGTPGTGMYFVDCTAQSGVHGIIANNFIWSNDSAGISMVNGDYQDLVHNSILMTGTTSSFAALLMRGSGSGKVVKNNILANFGGGYSYIVSDSAVFGIEYSDYNDIFTNGAFVGNYDGINRATLANWRAASQRDSNSVSVNPNFVSNTDLHSTSIAMDDRGKKYNNVTDDIDGQVRSAVTPDIGADEYSAAQRNVGVTAIIHPVDSTCGEAATIVSVVITNTGQLAESNFNVVTEITGSITQTLTKNHSTVIQPGQSDTLTYNANPLNTSAGGVYNLKSYTSLAIDDVHANDTLSAVIHLSAPPTPPGVSNSSICGPGSDTLVATSSDSILWYAASTGGSPIAGGPNFITPVVNATTTYYASALGSCEGARTAVTLSVLPVPSVNLGNDTTITQGSNVTLNAGGGASTYLWSTGQTTSSITVNTDGCYWVEYTNGSGCSAYDTLCVDVIFPTDMSISLNSSPVNNDCASDSIPVIIRVSNVGTSTATTIPVTVEITGAVTTTFTDTVTTLNAGSNVLLTMGTINVMAGGTITMKSYVAYAGDLDANNDTLTNVVNLIVPPNPANGISSSRCGSGPITLTATDTVLWYDAPTGGNLIFVGDAYFIPGLNVSTTFYIQNGMVCNNQQRVAINATINALPNVFLGNDTVVVDSIVLDAGAGFVTYDWTPSGTSQFYTATVTGPYSVCVTAANGCANCDTINVDILVGIENVSGNIAMNVYPNPARNMVTVELRDADNQKVSMSISDLQGQVIWEEQGSNMTYKTIDVSSFASGVYLLNVRKQNASSVYKLIIQ